MEEILISGKAPSLETSNSFISPAYVVTRYPLYFFYLWKVIGFVVIEYSQQQALGQLKNSTKFLCEGP